MSMEIDIGQCWSMLVVHMLVVAVGKVTVIQSSVGKEDSVVTEMTVLLWQLLLDRNSLDWCACVGGLCEKNEDFDIDIRRLLVGGWWRQSDWSMAVSCLLSRADRLSCVVNLILPM